MVRILPFIACFAAGSLVAQVRMPATTLVAVSELQAMAQRYPDATKLTEATQGAYPTAMVHGRCMVGFLGKVNGAVGMDLPEGAFLQGSRIGDIVSFRVDAYHLADINSINGLAYVELAARAIPTLDKVLYATHVDSVHAGIDLPQAYTGQDVLIGITDWGFDYTHPMFYDTALTTSRVRAAWDHYRQAGPAPAAFGYGTELTTTAALLATQADTANIYSYATHGTHVAGIAGGGGAGTVYRGVAFESQFLFCTFLVDAAAVIDAFTWMKDIAEQDQKRLVINMSWGLHWIGTLDGNSLIGQAIEQFAQEGVVFVSSAGNNGDVNFHIKKAFEADTLRSRMQFYPYTANPNMWGQSISMWGEESGAFSAGFAITTSGGQVLQETPWYHTATQPTYLDSFMVQGVDTVFFNLTADAAHPLNGRPHFRLRVKNTSAALRITLKATADPGTVHFWNVTELSNDVGNWGQEFQAPLTGYTVGDRNYGISEPACTENLIAVAAYNSEYLTTGGNPAGGSPASFSSYGPTLDDRMKPDLAAPGVTVASSISSFTDNSFSTLTTVDFQGRTYPFGRFSGTSMSSPAVAGIVALLLQADPTLTPAEVREVLKLTARADQYTGVIPPGGSTRWGSGKVNAYRAIREVLGPISVDEITATGMMIWPNPTHDELNIGMNGIGKVEIIVQDLTGRIVHADSYTSAQLIRIDTRSWTTGMYIVRLAQGDAVSLAKVIKQ